MVITVGTKMEFMIRQSVNQLSDSEDSVKIPVTSVYVNN